MYKRYSHRSRFGVANERKTRKIYQKAWHQAIDESNPRAIGHFISTQEWRSIKRRKPSGRRVGKIDLWYKDPVFQKINSSVTGKDHFVSVYLYRHLYEMRKVKKLPTHAHLNIMLEEINK